MSIDNPELHKEPYQFKNPYAKRFVEEFADIDFTEELMQEFDRRAENYQNYFDMPDNEEEKYQFLRSQLLNTNNLHAFYGGYIEKMLEDRKDKSLREFLGEQIYERAQEDDIDVAHSERMWNMKGAQVLSEVHEVFELNLTPEQIVSIRKRKYSKAEFDNLMFPVYIALRKKGYSLADLQS